MKKIIIFDTTLRDGEQSPGASLTPQQKLKIAKQLEALNVDIIETGFPISSRSDFESVKLISREVKKPVICGLARTLRKDIERCAQALKPAKKKRIHVFIATSDIHLKYKLKLSREDVIKMVIDGVRYARKFTDDVEFSPEDATRSDIDFLCKVIETAINSGARTINIPDTVGYSLPHEFGELIKQILEKVPNITKSIISVHCHNDLGLAVANSISGVIAGASQIECTINGIGERAGNAALEEIVMAIYARRKALKLYTDINAKEIYNSSKLVSSLTGLVVQPNKAIVGSNAFTHAAGIHQHGIIEKRLTYEIINPKKVGISSSRIVLSKHSGKHALEQRLKKLGYEFSQKELESIFEDFKLLSEKKKYIFDEDLIALAEKLEEKTPQIFSLQYFHISSGSGTIPTATIRLRKHEGKSEYTIQEAGCGNGPVDAAFNALEKIAKIKPKLLDYSLRSISSGRDAIGEVITKFTYKNKIFYGRGTSTDIIEASIKSYLNAINKILTWKTLLQ